MPVLKLNYFLKKAEGKKDFWIALSKREKMDLSGYRGITFKTRSSKIMRFWFELRTGAGNEEANFRHSALSGKEWKTIFIPFNKLHRDSGPETKLDLSRISAMFFAVNNAISYKNMGGVLELSEIGFY